MTAPYSKSLLTSLPQSWEWVSFNPSISLTLKFRPTPSVIATVVIEHYVWPPSKTVHWNFATTSRYTKSLCTGILPVPQFVCSLKLILPSLPQSCEWFNESFSTKIPRFPKGFDQGIQAWNLKGWMLFSTDLSPFPIHTLCFVSLVWVSQQLIYATADLMKSRAKSRATEWPSRHSQQKSGVIRQAVNLGGPYANTLWRQRHTSSKFPHDLDLVYDVSLFWLWKVGTFTCCFV